VLVLRLLVGRSPRASMRHRPSVALRGLEAAADVVDLVLLALLLELQLAPLARLPLLELGLLARVLGPLPLLLLARPSPVLVDLLAQLQPVQVLVGERP